MERGIWRINFSMVAPWRFRMAAVFSALILTPSLLSSQRREFHVWIYAAVALVGFYLSQRERSTEGKRGEHCRFRAVALQEPSLHREQHSSDCPNGESCSTTLTSNGQTWYWHYRRTGCGLFKGNRRTISVVEMHHLSSISPKLIKMLLIE